MTPIKMVKNRIKIYARVKDRGPSLNYEIHPTESYQYITLYYNSKRSISRDHLLSQTFRFDQICDQHSNQLHLYNEVARPIISSFLEGYNGTIFAYGQTGSGKTYTITGSPFNYAERGIIPRSIEEVFEYVNKAPGKYCIYISYFEIYNEIGYDLLQPKKISNLEELPKIILLEDSHGESHIRNLSFKRVYSEEEAMRLLFLGDTNRKVSETPVNFYSSRSHSIFTICLKKKRSGKCVQSKLNLVDLAGSERLSKTDISGSLLNEAKCINLSLHYLEQVIVALSAKKSHVPFRNSLLTNLLKDSLSGNCKTILLSTLDLHKKNVEESLATCKFSQRVASVNMETAVIKEVNPQQEIDYLKSEIDTLRRQLRQKSRSKTPTKLTEEEKQNWQAVINNYLNDSEEDIPLKNVDMRFVQYSFQLLKQAVKEHGDSDSVSSKSFDKKEVIQQYEEVIKAKEDEISSLKALLESKVNSPDRASRTILTKNKGSPSPVARKEIKLIGLRADYESLTPEQKSAFETFLSSPENIAQLEHYKTSIKNMYDLAQKLTTTLDQCQNNIISLKAQQKRATDRSALVSLELELQNQRSIYTNSLEKLQQLKVETEELKKKMEEVKLRLFEKFREWYNSKSQSQGDCNIEHRRFKTKIPLRFSSTSPPSPLRNRAPKEPNNQTQTKTLFTTVPLRKASLEKTPNDKPKPKSAQPVKTRLREKSPIKFPSQTNKPKVTETEKPRTTLKVGSPTKATLQKNKYVEERTCKSEQEDRIKITPPRPSSAREESFARSSFQKLTFKNVKDESPRKTPSKSSLKSKQSGRLEQINSKCIDLIVDINKSKKSNSDFPKEKHPCITPDARPKTPIKVIERPASRPKTASERSSNNTSMTSDFDESSKMDKLFISQIGAGIQISPNSDHTTINSLTESLTFSTCLPTQNPQKSDFGIQETPSVNDTLQITDGQTGHTSKLKTGPQKPERVNLPNRIGATNNFGAFFQNATSHKASYGPVQQLTSERPYSAELNKLAELNQLADIKLPPQSTQSSFTKDTRFDPSSFIRSGPMEPKSSSRIRSSTSYRARHNSLAEEKLKPLASPVLEIDETRQESPFQRALRRLNYQIDLKTFEMEKMVNCVSNPRRSDLFNHPPPKHRRRSSERQKSQGNTSNAAHLFLPNDSAEFRSFVSNIPLTGDDEVDEEIVKFYRTRYQ